MEEVRLALGEMVKKYSNQIIALSIIYQMPGMRRGRFLA